MAFLAQILPSQTSSGVGFTTAGFIAGVIGTVYALNGTRSYRASGNQWLISMALVAGLGGIIGGVMLGLERAPSSLWFGLLVIGLLAVVPLLGLRVLQIAVRPLRSPPAGSAEEPAEAPFVHPGAPPTEPDSVSPAKKD